MRADIYQKLHEFNQHIDHGIDTLRSMAQIKNVDSKEIQRYAEYFEELRSSSSGYLASIVFEQEEHVSGKLFRKRRHQEMADDPMHAGWLEEERARKQKQLRKAKSSSKKSVHRKSSQSP